MSETSSPFYRLVASLLAISILLLSSAIATAGQITIDFDAEVTGSDGYATYGDYQIAKFPGLGDANEIFSVGLGDNAIGDSVINSFGADFRVSRTDNQLFELVSLDVLFSNVTASGAVFASYTDTNNNLQSLGNWNQTQGGAKAINSILASSFVFTTFNSGLIDNIVLATEVPEPSTWFILLAGLALLIRRRIA